MLMGKKKLDARGAEEKVGTFVNNDMNNVTVRWTHPLAPSSLDVGNIDLKNHSFTFLLFCNLLSFDFDVLKY